VFDQSYLHIHFYDFRKGMVQFPNYLDHLCFMLIQLFYKFLQILTYHNQQRSS
jgi:hypothetical protein